jgi:hypothetical protein
MFRQKDSPRLPLTLRKRGLLPLDHSPRLPLAPPNRTMFRPEHRPAIPDPIIVAWIRFPNLIRLDFPLHVVLPLAQLSSRRALSPRLLSFEARALPTPRLPPLTLLTVRQALLPLTVSTIHVT